MAAAYEGGVAWLHCGVAATPQSVLVQLLELVRAVMLPVNAGIQFFADVCQCAPPLLCPV